MQKAAILITASEVSTAGQAGVLGIISQRTAGETEVAEPKGGAATVSQPRQGTFEVRP